MTKSSEESARSHDKPCTLCHTPRPVLVRCQIDETGKWHFVCPGKCWTSVSGGEIDAKGHKDEHPHYRYGGMWKNRHEDGPLNAKKPKQKHKNKAKKSTSTTATTGQKDDDTTGADHIDDDSDAAYTAGSVSGDEGSIAASKSG